MAQRKADIHEVDDCTVALVGSAPCFPHGVIDPIAALGAVALDRDIWLHVDACVGGWVAPFFAMNGRDIPAFDFAVAGVRSISADLHKFGFCPKPASTVFFRDRTDPERSAFVADAWPSGRFETSTLVGTRPGGGVAGAWAVLQHLGLAGYRDAARRLAEMADAYVQGIGEIDGLHLVAVPDLTILNVASDEVDMFAVADRMEHRGWLAGLTRRPPGLHLMASLFHAPVRLAWLADLTDAVEEVRRTGAKAEKTTASYS